MIPLLKQNIFRVVVTLAVWLTGGGMIGCGIRIFLCLKSESNAVQAVLLFLGAILCIGGGLMLFSYVWLLNWIGERFGRIVYPSAYLDAPAPELSPIRGKISTGRLEEARTDLLEHIASHAGHAAAYLMLTDLYLRKLNDPLSALKTAQMYLEGETRSPGKEAARLVLRAADCFAQMQRLDLAEDLLRKELENRIYSEAERKMLQKRLSGIAGSVFH